MKRLALAVALLIGLATPSQADLRDGIAAYARSDYTTAFREFEALAEQGDASGQFFLGAMYGDGRGVARNHAEAFKWYTKAAEQGLAGAQYNLGVMYSLGRGVPQDYAEAAKWFRKAAEQGHAVAQYSLGSMYDYGQGVPQDYAEGEKWSRKAAEQGYDPAQQGDDPAQTLLRAMYGSDEGVPQDLADLIRRVARSRAHAKAGIMAYWEGDYATALREFKPLAEQGDAFAQNKLGVIYDNGLGIPQDYAEAVKWYRKAASQGHAGAQNNLGIMYDNGQGVSRDYAEAVKWYRKAADQGNASAQMNLGAMYYNGQGVPRDYVRAHMWFNLAASQFASGSSRDRMVRNRERVAAKMTPAQIAEAQQLAREWRPKPSRGLTPAELRPLLAAPEAPLSTSLVASIQRSLAELGYDPGSADGVLGPKTRAAIRAFQADHDLAVTGEVSDYLAKNLNRAVTLARLRSIEAERRKPKKHSTGSGFVVSREGHVLTNYHVVEECHEVRIAPDSATEQLASDAENDLVLLKGSQKLSKSTTFRQGRGIRPGDTVVVAGFPLQGLLTSDLSITTGTVSALAGPGDDRRFLQITAPVQPGNSGGPLLDLSGNVVGVVVGKLDALKIARLTGDIPQNVNFAISAWTARAFLDAHSVPYETAPSARGIDMLAPADVAARARAFTVLVECWK